MTAPTTGELAKMSPAERASAKNARERLLAERQPQVDEAFVVLKSATRKLLESTDVIPEIVSVPMIVTRSIWEDRKYRRRHQVRNRDLKERIIKATIRLMGIELEAQHVSKMAQPKNAAVPRLLSEQFVLYATGEHHRTRVETALGFAYLLEEAGVIPEAIPSPSASLTR